MPQAKYHHIFATLQERIETGAYPFQSLLPSENQLAAEFGCTRNTVRKALTLLAGEGYIQAMQGRGVLVIHRRRQTSTFLIGGIESMREAARRNHLDLATHLISLERTRVDAALAERSGMARGADITVVRRLRLLDNVPLIVDTSCFLTVVVRATPEDRQFIHLAGMDCVAVVTSSTFDSSGTLFEYTVSRHSPVDFSFQATAKRMPAPRRQR